MAHALKGRKQKPEHIARRTIAIRKAFKLNPLPLKDRTMILLKNIIQDDKECWVWQGAKLKKPTGSYGMIRLGRNGGKFIRAHRLAYEIFIGVIPDGLEIDHLCHQTLCINPDHLEAVTHTENMRRRKDRNLPECRHGHLYTPETTYIRPNNGKRECITCRKIRQKQFANKHKLD